ncbi:hypothetical protein [Propionispira arboris]|nr:hypothetical protein [Propionispira arboris]
MMRNPRREPARRGTLDPKSYLGTYSIGLPPCITGVKQHIAT